MPYFVIFDKNVGRYQWGGQYGSADAALEDFDDKVGIDPNGEGLDVVAEKDFRVVEVTQAQFEAVESWHEAGSKSSEFPL